jgi:hypothetical protein
MDEMVELIIPKRWENAVLTLIGKLMNEEEKPFMYCCKCFSDCKESLCECTFCGKWMCDNCVGKLHACCPESQASIDEHYGPSA